MKIIADGNIAHLSDFFNEHTLGRPIELIAMAGREIDAAVIDEHPLIDLPWLANLLPLLARLDQTKCRHNLPDGWQKACLAPLLT